ncbi:recombinase family protein [Haloterrigena sp. SYSU A558-1]|uniref:Recombinase family protein n=1 Tax=Haloterrigena gelatinilytica TaxID=2741724 RepID=A0ABX2L5Y2_9EURY|nr:recombinase family protein [Haloterrigena gelatinilytica]NUC71664.1 recombinase family protein [Haloterrigena gelatinilytica]
MTEQEDEQEDVEIAAIYMQPPNESFYEKYIEGCKDATTDPDPTIYIDNNIDEMERTKFQQLLEDLAMTQYDVIVTTDHDTFPSNDGGLMAIFLFLVSYHNITVRYSVFDDEMDGQLLPHFEWDSGFDKAVERHNLHGLKGKYTGRY